MAVRTTEPTEIASGVWRLGTELVNWYLIEEDGGVTVVDAGAPKYWPQLDVGLARVGRSIGDVAAIVLTHAHSDHTGFAEQLRSETGVPVYVHADDESLATTGKQDDKREASFVPYLRFGHAWRLLFHLAGAGAMKPRPIGELTTYADGETLDVPGRPRVIHTPGTARSTSRPQAPSSRATSSCTLNPFTGARGPQLMPRAFNVSSAKCLDSLTKLADVEAGVVAVGHGEPWREGVAAAVERVRATGAT